MFEFVFAQYVVPLEPELSMSILPYHDKTE